MSDRHPSARRLVRERWDVLLVIAAGGALGSLGRWALAGAFPHGADHVAWGTFVANVTGAFLLGVLMVLVLDVWPPHRYVRPFLGVGVLGGYTTFSTYMLDTRALLASGEVPTALTYLFGTLLCGLAAVWAGIALTRALVAAGVRRRRRHRHRPQPSDRAGTPGAGSTPDPDQPTTRSPR